MMKIVMTGKDIFKAKPSLSPKTKYILKKKKITARETLRTNKNQFLKKNLFFI